MRHCCARTFKMLGPWIISKLFSKPVSCVAHYFCEFCKKRLILFLSFCTNSSFNSTFIFLTVIHTFFWFQGPSILTWGTLSHRSHMFQRFHLFLASLVMSQKNIRLEWFGRGNIDNIETKVFFSKQRIYCIQCPVLLRCVCEQMLLQISMLLFFENPNGFEWKKELETLVHCAFKLWLLMYCECIHGNAQL